MSPTTRRRVRLGLRTLERFLALFGLCALLYLICFDYSVIMSGSMSPALQGKDAVTGDRIIFEKITRRLRAPRRWEILQFHTPEGLTVAKRIVGLPGEQIALREGVVHINGAPLPIPANLSHLRYYAFGNLVGGRDFACGAGYYVLGDDSRDSYDSRYEGVLTRDRFTARAWLRIGPGDRFGFIR